MKDATFLPDDAGIGSNDKDFLARAERESKSGRPRVQNTQPPHTSPAIKSPMTRKGDGWRPSVGKDFPVGA